MPTPYDVIAEEEEDDPAMPQPCPACGSDAAGYLGRLGHLEHWRCRDCGAKFHSADPPYSPSPWEPRGE